ncbi:hypothetical protein V6N13_126857 [Hibiscus sabdariffa]|uniref:Uncharacterized protein n=1 Tax=Hibiscus sabdariffa TaxID=183260 RepID=A0ABR2REG2_9ROSI
MLLWLLEVNGVVDMTAVLIFQFSLQHRNKIFTLLCHNLNLETKCLRSSFGFPISLPKFFKAHILSKKLEALSRKLKGEAFYFFSPCLVFCPVTNSSKCLKLFHVNSPAVMP